MKQDAKAATVKRLSRDVEYNIFYEFTSKGWGAYSQARAA